ncbi:OLC1v1018321C4 [Oldenlandia corymbosa var. corymbosa]|uniref:non-specific serine/threonine protein kinase n=1 Tax=Oldenlandia corymbosa var. corymbosa TaxID=529605 RepID=A0AAV1EBB1_OLDCO|nr:OLC1v1018321C4 [Oldenlandia corymbosa var. corymbosa]
MTKMIIDDDTESSSSRASEFSPSPGRRRRLKVEEVYRDVLQRLQESEIEEAYRPDFSDELWNHFQRLPLRYALDVNIEKAQDVLMHKKLLDLARDPKTRPAFEVRFVQAHPFDGNADDTVHSSLVDIRDDENYRLHPPPTFNALSTSELKSKENKLLLLHSNNSVSGKSQLSRPLHEVTISTNDKPKLLTRLTALLSEVGLNIQEAHAFSTSDGYSLDVFLVDGWTDEETDQLINVLEKEIPKIELEQINTEAPPGQSGTEGCGDWEIDSKLVKTKQKIATGSNGDLYKGTYCGQDVAVKVLNTENLNDKIQKEFAQEVYILRKVRHKNVVQFIGACTRPPRLCIVTEYMRGGSIYDYLRKQKGVLKLPAVLKVALDVARGMSYLHQNNIVHRDLKTANLLMDENGVRLNILSVKNFSDGSYIFIAITVIPCLNCVKCFVLLVFFPLK